MAAGNSVRMRVYSPRCRSVDVGATWLRFDSSALRGFFQSFRLPYSKGRRAFWDRRARRQHTRCRTRRCSPKTLRLRRHSSHAPPPPSPTCLASSYTSLPAAVRSLCKSTYKKKGYFIRPWTQFSLSSIFTLKSLSGVPARSPCTLGDTPVPVDASLHLKRLGRGDIHPPPHTSSPPSPLRRRRSPSPSLPPTLSQNGGPSACHHLRVSSPPRTPAGGGRPPATRPGWRPSPSCVLPRREGRCGGFGGPAPTSPPLPSSLQCVSPYPPVRLAWRPWQRRWQRQRW